MRLFSLYSCRFPHSRYTKGYTYQRARLVETRADKLGRVAVSRSSDEPGNMPVCWGGGELNMGVCCCSIDSKKSVNDLGVVAVASSALNRPACLSARPQWVS
jgi:hypothetical protein